MFLFPHPYHTLTRPIAREKGSTISTHPAAILPEAGAGYPHQPSVAPANRLGGGCRRGVPQPWRKRGRRHRGEGAAKGGGVLCTTFQPSVHTSGMTRCCSWAPKRREEAFGGADHQGRKAWGWAAFSYRFSFAWCCFGAMHGACARNTAMAVRLRGKVVCGGGVQRHSSISHLISSLLLKGNEANNTTKGKKEPLWSKGRPASSGPEGCATSTRAQLLRHNQHTAPSDQVRPSTTKHDRARSSTPSSDQAVDQARPHRHQARPHRHGARPSTTEHDQARPSTRALPGATATSPTTGSQPNNDHTGGGARL